MDSTSEKHDMETPTKPKRLPITQKFYAFYHAPIVKFWFNTVSFLLCSMFFYLEMQCRSLGCFSNTRLCNLHQSLRTFLKTKKNHALLSWKWKVLDSERKACAVLSAFFLFKVHDVGFEKYLFSSLRLVWKYLFWSE